MALTLEFTPQFEPKEIYNFLTGVDTFFERKIMVSNYDFVEASLISTEIISLFCSIKESYNLLKKNRIINNFSVIIPAKQQVDLEIKMNLFIKSTVVDDSIRKKIIDAFISYDVLNDGGIDNYIHKVLTNEPELTSNMVSLIYSFKATKNGQLIEHRNQVNSILSQYNDIKLSGNISTKSKSKTVIGIGTHFKTEVSQGNVISLNNQDYIIGIVEAVISDTELTLQQNFMDTYTNVEIEIVGIDSEFYMIKKEGKGISVSTYFREQEIVAVLSDRKFVEQLPESQEENIHIIESKDEKDLDAVLQYETKGLDCPDLNVEQISILRVPTFPDFRTEIVWKVRDIGCGVKMTLPWFEKSQVRYVYQTLFACVAYRRNIDKYIFNSIVSATQESAKEAAVIGIWLESFEVALASFKAIFETKIESLIDEEKKCITAYLTVLQERGNWEDL